MKIVVLDEVELSDEQRTKLESVGNVTYYGDNPSTESETVRRLDGCDVAILGWTSVNGSVFDQLENLKMISVWATGYDYVDVAEASRQGVVVANVPSYAGVAVAEVTLGLLIELSRHVSKAAQAVRRGEYSWRPFRGCELRGKTLGVIGTGDIGGELCRIGTSLGMRVLGFSRSMSSVRSAEIGCQYVPLGVLLAESDYISLNVPLTAETKGMIGANELSSIKRGSYIISTTRADVIDQSALKVSLKSGSLLGAALDEAHLPDDELLNLSNVVVTPHIGFYTDEALVRKGDLCVDNVVKWAGGKPQNVVNAGCSS